MDNIKSQEIRTWVTLGLVVILAGMQLFGLMTAGETQEALEDVQPILEDLEVILSGAQYEYEAQGTTGFDDISVEDITASGDVSVGGVLTVTGASSFTGAQSISRLTVDATSDVIPLRVQGYTTQTSNLLTLEQSDGTDVVTATNAGNLSIAGAFDVEGNVSDNAGDLTLADNVAVTGTLDVQGASLEYGPNNLYPLGAGSSGFKVVWGNTTVTNTETASHGLTSPVWATCAYSGTLTDNEEQLCSISISGSTVTINTYKEDGTAGDSGVVILWQVIGAP
jgi:hypothetical protein